MVQLGERVAIFGRVAERLPPDTGRIQIMEADQLEAAQDVTELLQILGRFLWLVPLALAALAIWLAGDRKRSIVRMLAIGAIAAGMLVLVARSVAGNYVVDNLVQTESVRPAAADAWEILTALLRDGGRTLVGVGLVLLLGVWLVGPGRGRRRSAGASRRGSSARRSRTARRRSCWRSSSGGARRHRRSGGRSCCCSQSCSASASPR